MTTFHNHMWPALRSMIKNSLPARRLWIASGFIGAGAAEVIIRLKSTMRIEEIRFLVGLASPDTPIPASLADELTRLRRIASVRICAGLHCKFYLVDARSLLTGSANFSRRGFGRQHEAGVITTDPACVRRANEYFYGLWQRASLLPKRFVTYRPPFAGDHDQTHSNWLGEAGISHETPFSRLQLKAASRHHRSLRSSDKVGPGERPRVRLTAFDAWQLESKPWGFDVAKNRSRLSWGAAKGTTRGDRCVFCVSSNLKYVPELKNDRRVDAVHSIWEAIDAKTRTFRYPRYKTQIRFRRLVRLSSPVPKHALFDAGILVAPRWPQGVQGKLIDDEQVLTLAHLLAQHNPAQTRAIRDALGLRKLDETSMALVKMGGTMPDIGTVTRRRIGPAKRRD